MPAPTKSFADADYPADPYPGASPDCSFVHLDGVGHPLTPDPAGYSGWRLGTADSPTPDAPDLDGWLADLGAPPLAARVPVLSYGSNRCPSKITWLREQLGLTGPVVVLDAVTEGVAAVWAAGLRVRDGQRPAVLAAAPGVTERHAVWLATIDQVAVLDRCEGRGERYRLARLRTGRVRTEDGAVIERPWCYLAAGPRRAPLLVAGPARRRAARPVPLLVAGRPDVIGMPVRCAELDQRAARALVGTPADGDGLDADTVSGAPHPDEWPDVLFGYGLLQPGRDGWPLVAPHAVGPSRPVHARGSWYDTGLGWPAMLLGDRPDVPGSLTGLRDPVSLLAALDAYEGADYRRVRLTLPVDGTVTWAYVWVGDRRGLRALPPADVVADVTAGMPEISDPRSGERGGETTG